MHAHEEVGDGFLEFFAKGLKGDADVVAIEEMQYLFLQALLLLAFIQTLLQPALIATLRQQVFLRSDCIHQVALVFVSLADPQMSTILPLWICEVTKQ